MLKLIFVGLITALLTVAGAGAQDRIDVIEGVRPAVVAIAIYDRLAQPDINISGTGFGIGNGQYVATNYHVVQDLPLPGDGGQLAVVSGRGREAKVYPAEIIAVDRAHDMAILKLLEGRVGALELASPEYLARPGEDILMMGFPLGSYLGLFHVTHRGMISAVTPNLIPQGAASELKAELIRADRYLVYQLDLTSYPGNSGSPVFRSDTGMVIAILNGAYVRSTRESALTDPTGISYAIPVRHLRILMGRTDLSAD